MIYVILGQPRSGTHLVMSYLQSVYNFPTVHYSPDYKFDYADNTIVHTHDPMFTVDNIVDLSNVTLIVVKRQDLFSQLMSSAIAERSGQWVKYGLGNIKPFNYPIIDFRQDLLDAFAWYRDLELGKNYHEIIFVQYEHFIEYGVSYLSKKLGNSFLTIDLAPKSPFNFKDLIINWEELYNVYETFINVYNVYGYRACIQS